MLDKRILEDLKSKGFEVNEYGTLLKYNGSSGVVFIPDEITSIGARAFMGNAKLSTVYISPTVTRICESAFGDCKALATVFFRHNISRIEEGAFAGCISLKLEGLPLSLCYLGREAFMNCSKLSSLRIEAPLREIPEGCFRGCTSLCSVSLPSTVTDIGPDAFRSCTSLSSFAFRSGLRYIGSGAFRDCRQLGAEIKLPEGVEYIGEYAFAYCNERLFRIYLPSSLTAISRGAFSGCKRLAHVIGFEMLQRIDDRAFEDCCALCLPPPSSHLKVHKNAFLRCKIKNIFPTLSTFDEWVFDTLGERYNSYAPSSPLKKLLISPFFVSFLLLLLLGGGFTVLEILGVFVQGSLAILIAAYAVVASTVLSYWFLIFNNGIGWKEKRGRWLYLSAPMIVGLSAALARFGGLLPDILAVLCAVILALASFTHWFACSGFHLKEDATYYIRRVNFGIAATLVAYAAFIITAAFSGIFTAAPPHFAFIILYSLCVVFYLAMLIISGDGWRDSILGKSAVSFDVVINIILITAIPFIGSFGGWVLHLTVGLVPIVPLLLSLMVCLKA